MTLNVRPEHLSIAIRYLDKLDGSDEEKVAGRLVSEWLRVLTKDILIDRISEAAGLSRQDTENSQEFQKYVEILDL